MVEDAAVWLLSARGGGASAAPLVGSALALSQLLSGDAKSPACCTADLTVDVCTLDRARRHRSDGARHIVPAQRFATNARASCSEARDAFGFITAMKL